MLQLQTKQTSTLLFFSSLLHPPNKVINNSLYKGSLPPPFSTKSSLFTQFVVIFYIALITFPLYQHFPKTKNPEIYHQLIEFRNFLLLIIQFFSKGFC